ncbi:MAG TPA: DUF6544 family protein [Segeticoccus sp.]|uniref:DUF6544 family protein n=1 Tax=Segeticoccus sp. TaxID=2706531 RepID=UPI002D7EB3CB|nr:DUF6544 family protein [Segeticoccus sp.]HET8598759.1 DUF6544 family protein [Segeticoccus sp.]
MSLDLWGLGSTGTEEPLRAAWSQLCPPRGRPQAFRPEIASALPEPARRWIRHAIVAGTPMWRSVELHMEGEIRVRGWRRFVGREVLAPPCGYFWTARTRMFGVPVSGFDRFSATSGEMRWHALGTVPVLHAGGSDVSRSAAGRLAAEAVWLPTSFGSARWLAGDDADTAVARWHISPGRQRVELRVAPDGVLRGVRMMRWGNPDGVPFGWYPFGVTVEEERRFGGVTIPSMVRASWFVGTDRAETGEFFRARVTRALFH